MTNIYHRITIWIVIALVIIGGITGRYLRHDTNIVSADLAQKLNNEAEVNFDAPLYELITQPIPHVDSYNSKTHAAVVGLYSWFGVRVGGVTMPNCLTHTSIIFGDNFGCDGGSVQYLF